MFVVCHIKLSAVGDLSWNEWEWCRGSGSGDVSSMRLHSINKCSLHAWSGPGSGDLVVIKESKVLKTELHIRRSPPPPVVIYSLCDIDMWLKQTPVLMMYSAAGISWVPIYLIRCHGCSSAAIRNRPWKGSWIFCASVFLPVNVHNDTANVQNYCENEVRWCVWLGQSMFCLLLTMQKLAVLIIMLSNFAPCT